MNQETVLTALNAATSQVPAELKWAEAQLKEWEVQPGFYSTLLQLATETGVPDSSRWMAVLYFKNGVDLYWRRTARNCIPDSERPGIRATLLNFLVEPVAQIASQVAVLIARIARFDCPKEWPELIPFLLHSACNLQAQLSSSRALLTLHHVVKTLASKRLAADRRTFHQLAEGICPQILAAWDQLHSGFLQHPEEQELLERTRLALKILRRLVVHGFRQPDQSSDCQRLLMSVFGRCDEMLQLRASLIAQQSGVNTQLLNKYIVLHTKVLADVLETHPFSFVQLIPGTLNFCACHVFTENTGGNQLFDRFVIQCLNLIKSILVCAEYRPSKCTNDNVDPRTAEAHRLKNEFFSSQPLEQICRHLVSKFFPLSADDLASWDLDPEQYVVSEEGGGVGGEAWRYSLRPCTECLFVALFRQFQKEMAPVVLSMLEETLASQPQPQDARQVLGREAVYNAVGLAAFDLYEEVDFDRWLSSGLLQELAVPDSNYRVVRRRVIWLIGRWVSVKLSASLRPQVYSAVIALLSNPDEDLAVRLAAAQTLKDAVDDFEFSPDTFQPFLSDSFQQLFRLLLEVKECDTKMLVLNVISYIIERLESAVRPHCSQLVSYLPRLWDDSEAHDMLRVVILSTLAHLVQALGADSTHLYPLLVPVISLSTDLSGSAHVYLLEDGLILWLAAVENAPNQLSESDQYQLLSLYQKMPSLMELGTETLQTMFSISQAYVLLMPDRFLGQYGSQLGQACTQLIPEMKPDGIVMILRLVETSLRAAGRQALQIFSQLFPGCLQEVLYGQPYPMLLSTYLSLLSRLLLMAPDLFCELLGSVSGTQEDVLNRLLDVWLDKMGLVTQAEQRKLLSLALCSLLPTCGQPVASHINSLLLNVVETLNDITRPDQQLTDTLVVTSDQRPAADEDGEEDYETAHDVRRRGLASTDPVHTQVLRDILQSSLVAMRSAVGERKYSDLLSDVDVETSQQLQEYVQLL